MFGTKSKLSSYIIYIYTYIYIYIYIYLIAGKTNKLIYRNSGFHVFTIIRQYFISVLAWNNILGHRQLDFFYLREIFLSTRLFIKEHTYSIQWVRLDQTNREDWKRSKMNALESQFLLTRKAWNWYSARSLQV